MTETRPLYPFGPIQHNQPSWVEFLGLTDVRPTDSPTERERKLEAQVERLVEKWDELAIERAEWREWKLNLVEKWNAIDRKYADFLAQFARCKKRGCPACQKGEHDN